ncbi:tetratricopeptide repeat protein [Mucilaginibacter sp. Bleaf8]|uniref:tetratricopeptide repeat protein n=1 Tax=Mucilaginibacter sp. Bleaf8 TaxID=2834430 RepID=UPI001BCE1AE6|nr:tetratricopeptide repeat protein [Mucilaginibacter sp. Bleaf8]MBS7567049.1 tetratricopeptide repeat protein [Mucilaginibacter sp. Bleaf8]
MLLGSTHTRQPYGDEELFINHLITQSRYAEAYILLQKESPDEPATQYNLALCHYWAGNFREALVCLDKAQVTLPAVSGNAATDQFYTAIRKRQNQLDNHLQAITKKYIACFGVLTREAIVRLRTDCWLQLADFSKVIEVATPLANKNYKNISDALQIAKNKTNL